MLSAAPVVALGVGLALRFIIRPRFVCDAWGVVALLSGCYQSRYKGGRVDGVHMPTSAAGVAFWGLASRLVYPSAALSYG